MILIQTITHVLFINYLLKHLKRFYVITMVQDLRHYVGTEWEKWPAESVGVLQARNFGMIISYVIFMILETFVAQEIKSRRS